MIQRIHRRYVHGIYALLAFSILTLAASFFALGIRPLAHQLQLAHEQNLQQFVINHGRLIQATVDKHFDICRQAGALTRARHALHDYVEGRVPHSQVVAVSRPLLLDLLRYNSELLSLTRFDRQLEEIIGLGAAIDPIHYLDHLPDGRLIEMRGPVLAEGRSVLLYYSPILQEETGALGYDLLEMDTAGIQRIIDNPYSEFGNIYLVQNEKIIYRPRAENHRVPPHVFEAYLHGQLIEDNYILLQVPIAYTGWSLYMLVDQSRSLGAIQRSTHTLIGVMLVTMLLIFVASAVVLRPIIRALTSHNQLYELSYRDGLTGLYNHRHFQNVMDHEVTRAERYGNPLSMLMIDIDHFKQINDTYGHQCGDDVLRKISAIITSTVRTTDTAARYGGEEFAVVLPETDHEAARKLAERLRLNVARTETLVRNKPLRATVSIGLATYDPALGKRGKGDIIQAADQALYRSKRAGRNCVTDASGWQSAAGRADEPTQRTAPLRDRK